MGTTPWTFQKTGHDSSRRWRVANVAEKYSLKRVVLTTYKEYLENALKDNFGYKSNWETKLMISSKFKNSDSIKFRNKNTWLVEEVKILCYFWRDIKTSVLTCAIPLFKRKLYAWRAWSAGREMWPNGISWSFWNLALKKNFKSQNEQIK